MIKFLGITLVVLALVLAIVPTFTDCQSQGKAITLASGKTIPMKCHWTGTAEIAVGVPLLVVGGMMTASRKKPYLMSLGIMGALLGTFAILLPTAMIGVCQTTMLCNTAMSPTLITAGSAAILISLGIIFFAWKKGE